MLRTELKYNQIGVGSIVIPEDFDRTAYINQVYNIGMLAVHVQDYGILHVHVSESILNHIEFPETSEEFGSLVSFFKMPVYNKYVAFSVLKKSSGDSILNEHSFRLGKRSGDKVVEVIGNAADAGLVVNVQSDESDSGSFTMNVSNKDGTALFDLKVGGKAKVEAGTMHMDILDKISLRVPKADGKETVMSYEAGVGFSYTDEFENTLSITKDGVEANSDKYKIGTKSLSVKDLLYGIIDDIAKATVSTSIGEMPLKIVPATMKKEIDKIFK